MQTKAHADIMQIFPFPTTFRSLVNAPFLPAIQELNQSMVENSLIMRETIQAQVHLKLFLEAILKPMAQFLLVGSPQFKGRNPD